MNAMLSFQGVGGNFQDIEFCDTSLLDPQSGANQTLYPWWLPFSEGKRFYVPRVAALNGQAVRFDIKQLVGEGRRLILKHKSQYPNADDFGRKSFDKILKYEAMSFAKAVMATRTINSTLAH